jgi:hypothetical protein
MTFDNSAFDRRVDRTGFILLVLASGITFFLYSGRAALSLALGGVLSTVNFHWLKQAVDFVILEGGSGSSWERVVWQYAGRYALIALTLYVTIDIRFWSGVDRSRPAGLRLSHTSGIRFRNWKIMEEHQLLIVKWVNELLGPPFASLLSVFGVQVPAGKDVIPMHLVMGRNCRPCIDDFLINHQVPPVC